MGETDSQDIYIRCGETTVTAHKLVLSACSPWFRSVISSLPPSQPQPLVVLWDTEARDMRQVLSFMYRGQVQVQQENLVEFLKLDGRLEVKGLTDSDGEVTADDGLLSDDTESDNNTSDTLNEEEVQDPRSRMEDRKQTETNDTEESIQVHQLEDQIEHMKAEAELVEQSLSSMVDEMEQIKEGDLNMDDSNPDFDSIDMDDELLPNIVVKTELKEAAKRKQKVPENKKEMLFTELSTEDLVSLGDKVGCPQCGKFMKPKSLYEHAKSVHSDQTYTCVPCQKTFGSKRTFLTHQQRKCPQRYLFKGIK